MKYTVRIADRSYEVEIEDLHARPVIARVDGQRFEISPENGIEPVSENETSELTPVELLKRSTGPGANGNELTAPLPGVVVEIFTKPGEQIEAGQVLLVIEAMKMKNSIRSTRAGQIAEVLVSAGQIVAHRQALVRFG